MINDINSSVGKAAHTIPVYDSQRGIFPELVELYSEHLYIPVTQQELRAVGITGFFVHLHKN